MQIKMVTIRQVISKRKRLHKKARGRYQTFATTEKEEKGQYGRERYKNLPEH